MVGVADSAVEVAELVADHVLHVGFVEKGGEALLEVDGESLVEEVQEGVDEGGGNCYQTQVEDSLYHNGLVLLDDGLHNLAIEVSNVDAQESPQNQEDRQQTEVQDFLAFPCGNNDLQQFFDSLEEEGIDVSLSSFLSGGRIT